MRTRPGSSRTSHDVHATRAYNAIPPFFDMTQVAHGASFRAGRPLGFLSAVAAGGVARLPRPPPQRDGVSARRTRGGAAPGDAGAGGGRHRRGARVPAVLPAAADPAAA